MRVAADVPLDLVGHLLRGRADVVVTIAGARDVDGRTAIDVEPTVVATIDERRNERRAGENARSAGVRRKNARRPKNRTSSRSLPRCRSTSSATIRLRSSSARMRNAASMPSRTVMVSISSAARNSRRRRSTSSLRSRLATTDNGMSVSRRSRTPPSSQLPKCGDTVSAPVPLRIASNKGSPFRWLTFARISSSVMESARMKSTVSRA